MSRSTTSLSRFRHPRTRTANVISSEVSTHAHRRLFQDETVSDAARQNFDTRRRSDAWARQYRPLVIASVQQLKGKAPPGADELELLGQAYEALVHARRRFDPSRGVEFGAYARLRVRGAVLDSIRRQWAELAEANELNLATLPAPESAAADARNLKGLFAAMTELPARERLLFGLYYEAELSLQEVAEIVGLSASHVCQLLRQAREQLRQHMETSKKVLKQRQAFDGTAE